MKHDRLWKIRQRLLQEKRVTIRELCNEFDVSVETARRDLNALEEEGFVRRAYGGAMLVENGDLPNLMPPWNARFSQNMDEKRAIAREMLRWIPDHSTIALDSGTTTFELAKLLREKKDLTILTNDLRTAVELSAHTEHTIYSIGGAIKKDDMITTGFLAMEFLEHFSRFDFAILSADGFDIHTGMTDHNIEMGRLKRAMLNKSGQIFAAIDHSKFFQNAVYKICDITALNMVITGEQAPAEAIRVLNDAGIRTVLVKS